MIVRVDAASAVPPYEQLRAQIAGLVGSTALPVGARLPTVRGLAEDLGLAPGTVARAYRELERDGCLETRGRHGTYVAASPRLTDAARRAQLRRAAQAYAAQARQIGLGGQEAQVAVLEALTQEELLSSA